MQKGTPVLSDYSQQSASSGRRLGRIRHLYRPSRPVRDILSMRLHTLNCQGFAWHRLQHRDKLVQLLLHMRSSKADLMALTELHGTMGPCVVHIEDFVLVTNDRAGWLMTLEFYVLWSQSGKGRWDRGDNLCALRLDLCNKTYVFVAVYLLPFVRVADRRQSLAELDLLRADFPPGCHEVLAGDWNAHAGLDHVGDHIHQGQFSLSTPTTMGGRIHRSWLYGKNLCMVDSFRPCAKRATWRHRNGNFYELDFFCASLSIRKEFQNVTTFSSGISDHWGKQVVMHFSDPDKGQTRQARKTRFLQFSRVKQLQQQRQRLPLDDMRGPSEEAGRKRRLFRNTIEAALDQQGIPLSVSLADAASLPQSDFAAILYTDGSYGEHGSTTAGWGLHVALPDGIEQFCAPVSISEVDVLFHGAYQHSNNTGELEALGIALKWIHTYVHPNSAVQITFDSQYAANMVRGIWQPETNISLIQWGRWQLTRVHSKGIHVNWKWVRGHQGDHGNEMADCLAKEGARGRVKIFPALEIPDHMTPLPLAGMLPSRVRHTVKHGGPKPRPPWNGLDSPWFMNCDFANTEPLLPWDTLSSILVNGAQQVLGRTAPRLGAPYSPEDMHEITEMRNDLALLWSRLQNSDNAAEQQRLKHQHRMCNRQLQRFRSKARVRFVRTLCNEAEQHMRYHDMGRFYKSLKKIGVHLSDQTFSGRIAHDLSALREHCQSVSGSVQEVSDEVLSHVPWGTVAPWLGLAPSPDEVRLAVRRLRDCSPGRDEVTAGMLRWAGPRAMDCIISIIQ